MKNIFITLTFCLFITACSEPAAISDDAEIVLKAGTSLKIEGLESSFEVIAKKGTSRRYIWNDCKLFSKLDFRSERWFGKLGIYDHNAAYIPFFNGCDGISKPLVDEAQIHFSNRSDLDEWLRNYATGTEFKTVWTSDGLLVRFILTPNRPDLSVNVAQLCLNGEKPINLRLPEKGTIRISHSNSENPLYGCVKVEPKVMRKTMRDWNKFWDSLEK